MFSCKSAAAASKRFAERFLFRSYVSVTYAASDTLYEGSGNGKQFGCTSAVSGPYRVITILTVCTMERRLLTSQSPLMIRCDPMQFNGPRSIQGSIIFHFIIRKKIQAVFFPICFHCRSISDVEMGRTLRRVSLRRAAAFLFTCKSRQYQWQRVHVNLSHQENH